MASPAVKPDDIKACLEETKALLQAVIEKEPDFRLKNCLGNLEKIEALMKGDYETVWRIETDQRRRDTEFHERFVKNLRTIQKERLDAALKPQCVHSNEPLLAALAALRACRPVPLPALNPMPQTTPETDPDLCT